MPWINAFDLGECEIDIYKYDQYIDPGDYSSYNLTVNVIDGVVVVEAWGSEPGDQYGLDGIRAWVRPLYPTEGRDARIVGTETENSEYNAFQAVVAADPVNSPWFIQSIGATDNDPVTYDPDPVVFEDIPNQVPDWTIIGVEISEGT